MALSLTEVEELEKENKALRRVIAQQGEELGRLRQTQADILSLIKPENITIQVALSIKDGLIIGGIRE